MTDASTSLHATITGPVPGPLPTPVGSYDLATLGYLEEEYFLSGTATSYAMVGDRGEDGQWTVAPAESASFTTRVIVRRPVDAAAFSGTVVVEWLNVSAGGDGGPEWTFMHRHMIREGMAWVGVSAQRVGIEGGGFVEGMHLKKVDPARYGDLAHPGDAYAYDIFMQAARAVRGAGDVAVLGPLSAERVIAAGESQSAGFLVTYINAVDPLTQVFDAFIAHGRGGPGSALEGMRMPTLKPGETLDLEKLRAEARNRAPERLRADVRVPVMTIQSETDTNNMGDNLARQPDDDRVRLWEIAGTAHGDAYLVIAGAADDGTLSAELMAEMLAPTRELLGSVSEEPINTGPQQHYVAQAALAHVDRWVRDGTPPPSAPRLALKPDGGYETDANGNAVGGIRTPWVDAPIATLSGLGGAGGGWASLFGRTAPFDAATLASLYPGGRDDYLARARKSLSQAVDGGFILAADVAEIEALLGACYPS